MVETLIREKVPQEKRALAHFKDAMARSAAYAVTRSMAYDLGEDISEYSDEAAELTEELMDMPAVESGLTSGEVRKAYWAAAEYTRDNLLPYLQEAFSERGMDADEAVDRFYERVLGDEEVAVEAFSLGDEDVDAGTAVERQEEIATLFNDPEVYEHIISDAADRRETARDYYNQLLEINQQLVEEDECGNVEHYGTVNHVHWGDVNWGIARGPGGGPGAGPGEPQDPGDGPEEPPQPADDGLEVAGMQYHPAEPGSAGRVFVQGKWLDENIGWASNEPEITYMLDLPAHVDVDRLEELEVRSTEEFFSIEDEENGEQAVYYDEREMETLGTIEQPDIEVVARNAEGTMVKVSGLDPVTYDGATEEFIQMRAYFEGQEDPLDAWDILEIPERTLGKAAREKGGLVERVYEEVRERYYEEDWHILGTARNLLTGKPNEKGLGEAAADAFPLIQKDEDEEDGYKLRTPKKREVMDEFIGSTGGHLANHGYKWLSGKILGKGGESG